MSCEELRKRGFRALLGLAWLGPDLIHYRQKAARPPQRQVGQNLQTHNRQADQMSDGSFFIVRTEYNVEILQRRLGDKLAISARSGPQINRHHGLKS